MAEVEAILINDTRVDLHHGCSRVVAAIHALADASNIRIIGAAPAHLDWRRNEAFVSLFDRADLVIVNGEGSIHRNRPEALPLLAAGATARRKGKRSALINMSWFDNDGGYAEALAHFDIVAARESASQEAVEGVRPDCRMVPDLSLYGARSDSEGRAGVGFGDSVLLHRSTQLLDACDRNHGGFVPIRFARPGLSGTLRLMRSLVSRRMFASVPELRTTVRLAFEHFRHEIRDSTEFLEMLSRLRLLVTGRFHGMTLALCAHTPILAVPSNTRKIEALLSDAGLNGWRLAAPAWIDRDLIEKASHFDERERSNVGHYLNLASEQAETLFRDIKALA